MVEIHERFLDSERLVFFVKEDEEADPILAKFARERWDSLGPGIPIPPSHSQQVDMFFWHGETDYEYSIHYSIIEDEIFLRLVNADHLDAFSLSREDFLSRV